jgi:hypothetical protein
VSEHGAITELRLADGTVLRTADGHTAALLNRLADIDLILAQMGDLAGRLERIEARLQPATATKPRRRQATATTAPATSEPDWETLLQEYLDGAPGAVTFATIALAHHLPQYRTYSGITQYAAATGRQDVLQARKKAARIIVAHAALAARGPQKAAAP